MGRRVAFPATGTDAKVDEAQEVLYSSSHSNQLPSQDAANLADQESVKYGWWMSCRKKGLQLDVRDEVKRGAWNKLQFQHDELKSREKAARVGLGEDPWRACPAVQRRRGESQK